MFLFLFLSIKKSFTVESKWPFHRRHFKKKNVWKGYGIRKPRVHRKSFEAICSSNSFHIQILILIKNTDFMHNGQTPNISNMFIWYICKHTNAFCFMFSFFRCCWIPNEKFQNRTIINWINERNNSISFGLNILFMNLRWNWKFSKISKWKHKINSHPIFVSNSNQCIASFSFNLTKVESSAHFVCEETC